ncbi:hypothetical protein A3H75_02340 [Candidatus Uhrbacteria bacterium RIFCSPLOWO2_02_FULL_51_9]|uniref:Uncharacterized protein n=1 Tax=Candidatus Uhrbacteria bacterium RIFCSPLOWO2_02_FULL_51_9 TaxID=1802410 RepID=A0A1F7VEB7_9BACT|nr:MAG: hypothetical protein A3H75_02340 [Candidatus Uhrbacteria bacterium RIFCSPLOWO2_02_FULL_51_9]
MVGKTHRILERFHFYFTESGKDHNERLPIFPTWIPSVLKRHAFAAHLLAAVVKCNMQEYSAAAPRGIFGD